MHGANSVLMAYLKKLLFGADGPLRTQNFTSCLTALDLLYCFTILHNERGQERNGNIINGFSERNLIQSNLVILEQKWYGVLLTLNLLSGFLINFTQQKGSRGTRKFYLFVLFVVFEKISFVAI